MNRGRGFFVCHSSRSSLAMTCDRFGDITALERVVLVFRICPNTVEI